MAHSLFLLSVSAKGYKGNAQAKMKIYERNSPKKIEICLHAYMKFGEMPYFKGVSEDSSLHKAYIKPT
jgi:hypothetical protein